jgi:curved DNA-binding protein CbpA
MRLEVALNTLGLSPPITREEIKKQFRKTVKRYDPSLSNNNDEPLRRAIEAKQLLLNNFDLYFNSAPRAVKPKAYRVKPKPTPTDTPRAFYRKVNKTAKPKRKYYGPLTYVFLAMITLMTCANCFFLLRDYIRNSGLKQTKNSYLSALRELHQLQPINKTSEEEEKLYPPILATKYFIFEGDFLRTTDAGYTIKFLWEYSPPNTDKTLIRDEFQAKAMEIRFNQNLQVPQVEFKFDPKTASGLSDEKYEAKGYNNPAGLIHFLKLYRTKVIIHCPRPPHEWPDNIYLPSNSRGLLYF